MTITLYNRGISYNFINLNCSYSINMNNVNEIFNFYIKSNNSLSSLSKDFLMSLIEHENNKIEFLNCLEYNNLSHKIFTLWNFYSSFDLEKILQTYYIEDISKCLLEDLFLLSYTILRNHNYLNIDIIKYLKNISTVFKQSIKKTLIMYDINNNKYDIKKTLIMYDINHIILKLMKMEFLIKK